MTMRCSLCIIFVGSITQAVQSAYRLAYWILFTFVLKNGGGTAPLGIAGKG